MHAPNKFWNQDKKEKYHERYNPTFEYAVKHFLSGGFITKDFFRCCRFSSRFSEITVSQIVLQVFPSTVVKHLYILCLMRNTIRIIIKLINYIFGFTSFKMVIAEARYLNEFPARLMHLPKICLFFFIFKNGKELEHFFLLHGYASSRMI